MTFQCAHRSFTAAIEDVTHGYLGRGNVISNTQHSTFVRAATETGCNGYFFEPGRLRDFDLSLFDRLLPNDVCAYARAITTSKSIILYRFFHWKGQERTEHGWLITDTGHRELRRFVTGPTWKSRDVMRAVAESITVQDQLIAA